MLNQRYFIAGAPISQNQFVSHVPVQVITNAVCAATYGTLTVRDTTICVATTGGRGTCGGDSGGPLAFNNQLVSSHFYLPVLFFRPFGRNIISEENLSKNPKLFKRE